MTHYAGIKDPLATFLLRLYPAIWRSRYEEEFRDVLEQCNPTPAVIADVCQAAFCAHFTYKIDTRRASARRMRTRRRALIAATCIMLSIDYSVVRIGGGRSRGFGPLSEIFG